MPTDVTKYIPEKYDIRGIDWDDLIVTALGRRQETHITGRVITIVGNITASEATALKTEFLARATVIEGIDA